MSRPWQREIRVALCPDRLVLAPAARPLEGDAAESLRTMAKDSLLTVVLSNHLVRYTVLPWSPALRSDEDWLAYAQHAFATNYGSAAAGWSVRVSAAERQAARVASAIDTSLLESLLAVSSITSIQPYLMAAFNARRTRFRDRTVWFVVQEPGRLTVSLVSKGVWKVVRSRQAGEDWQSVLPDVLDREFALNGDLTDCDEVLLYSEAQAPSSLGRYRISDITLRRGESSASRPIAMVLH